MLKRTDKYSDKRFYYDTGTKKFYVSATTFCSYVLPENPVLTKWKQELGVFEATRRTKEAALYGTLLHLIIEDFVGKENYTLHQMEIRAEEFVATSKMEHNLSTWKRELKKDILSFAQFAFERKIDVISAEQWIKKDINEFGGIAGTVDLELNLDWSRARRKAILDIKSGKKGFYPSHELQLCLYKEVLSDPDLLLFNWAPNDWDLKPTYKLKNQTDSKMSQKIDHYIQIANVDGMFSPKLKVLDFDIIKMGDEPVFQIRNMEEIMELEETTTI